METKSYRFISQKNKWGWTVLSVVLCMLCMPFVSVMAFIPRLITILPLALIIMLGHVGPVSVGISGAVMTAFMGFLFGVWGVVGALIFLVPIIVASGISVERKYPFWQSSAVCAGIMLGCEYLVLVIVSVISGTDAISAVMQLFVNIFNENPALSDMMVDLLMELQVVSVNSSISSISALTSADRISILQSLLQSMDQLLRMEIPMQIATGAVSAGILGQFILRKGMLSHGEKVDCPPVRFWNIPKGWGRVMGITFLLMYTLNLVSSNLNAMFVVISGVFEQVFALQGIACMCYLAHKKGKGSGWQVFLFVLGYFVLNVVAIIMGIMDQTFDFTHRREEIEKRLEQQKRENYDPKSKNLK